MGNAKSSSSSSSRSYSHRSIKMEHPVPVVRFFQSPTLPRFRLSRLPDEISRFLALLSLSPPPSPRISRWIGTARIERSTRISFPTGRSGAEWRGERGKLGEGRRRIRDPRMFPQSRARALFCRFVSGVPGTILMRGNDLPGFAAPRENLIIEKVVVQLDGRSRR